MSTYFACDPKEKSYPFQVAKESFGHEIASLLARVSLSARTGTEGQPSLRRSRLSPAASFAQRGARSSKLKKMPHRQYTGQSACTHRMGRRGYTNGAGFCVHCEGFFARAFPRGEQFLKLGFPLLQDVFEGESVSQERDAVL